MTLQTLEALSLSELFSQFDTLVADRPYLRGDAEVVDPQWLAESVANAIDDYHKMIDIAVNGDEVDEELLTVSLEILEVELTHLLKNESEVQRILDKLYEQA